MTDAFFGHLGIWLAFACAIGGLAVGALGRTKLRSSVIDARVFAPMVLVGVCIAVGAMEHALITHDFSLVYVADNNARATPLLYSITGLWSALAGSILLWGLALAVFLNAIVWRYRASYADDVVAWATLVMFAITTFFFFLLVGPADPFTTIAGRAPLSGAGPNSLLQDNPLVAIHPPLLYLGFVGCSVPFAFAVAMLITGRIGERWSIETRRWTLVSWTCLSVGIVLGAWWSYQVLGWGGFWGWDPVENAALMPWLCSTAYLHSVLVQERRGLLRVWNLTLAIATFALTIFGTFLTRSGVIQSVHAFSESSIGPILITFFILVLVVGLGLIAWRADRLRSPGGIDAPLSREGAFLVNNVLFVGFAFVILLGTVFPLLYQAFTNQQVTVGAPFFNTAAVPIGLGLLFMMAVAPALSWRKIDAPVLWGRLRVPAWMAAATIVVCVLAGVRGLFPLTAFLLGAFAGSSALRALVLSMRASHRHGAGLWRGLIGRTNGGMVVHLGVVTLAVGLAAATSFAHRDQLTLRQGQLVHYDGHTFVFEGLHQVNTASRQALEAFVLVDGTDRLHPAISEFAGSDSIAVGTPAIDSGFEGDVYLTLNDVPSSTGNGVSGGEAVSSLAPNAIALGVVIQPLLAWMWAGGLIVGLGGLLALVPGSRRRSTDPVSAPSVLVQSHQSDGRDLVMSQVGGEEIG